MTYRPKLLLMRRMIALRSLATFATPRCLLCHLTAIARTGGDCYAPTQPTNPVTEFL